MTHIKKSWRKATTTYEKARTMLHIVVAAARPLTLSEMNIALEEIDLEPDVSLRTTV